MQKHVIDSQTLFDLSSFQPRPFERTCLEDVSLKVVHPFGVIFSKQQSGGTAVRQTTRLVMQLGRNKHYSRQQLALQLESNTLPGRGLRNERAIRTEGKKRGKVLSNTVFLPLQHRKCLTGHFFLGMLITLLICYSIPIQFTERH